MHLLFEIDNVVSHGRKIISHNTGGTADTNQVLQVCIQNNIYPDIEIIDVDSINDAYEKVRRGEVKESYVTDMPTL
jgi:uncharacterized zinc-type alcohol dehydrogenase-like protein